MPTASPFTEANLNLFTNGKDDVMAGCQGEIWGEGEKQQEESANGQNVCPDLASQDFRPKVNEAGIVQNTDQYDEEIGEETLEDSWFWNFVYLLDTPGTYYIAGLLSFGAGFLIGFIYSVFTLVAVGFI